MHQYTTNKILQTPPITAGP